MKTLKQIIESDYTDPKSPGDKAFVDKHVVQKTDYPHTPKGGSNDEVFSGKKQKKKKRNADPEDGQDKEVNEMTAAQTKKKEAIVKGMKKNTDDFIKRYGKDGESVMNATATKMAQEEAESHAPFPHAAATPEETKILKSLWEDLNDENKKQLEQAVLTAEGLAKVLGFANQGWGE